MKQILFLVHHAIVWCAFILAAVIAVFLLNSGVANAADDPFVTTWKTNAQYSSADSLSFKINPDYHGTVSYTVDWGDGNVQTGITGDVQHDYVSPGTYTVEITGDFPGFYFKEPNNTPALLLSVDSWGDIVWKNADYAFADATIMQINATDAPDLSQSNTVKNMFLNAYNLNSPINNWDVSTIVNFEGMFEGAQNFDQPLNNWDTSLAENMWHMFYNARDFNQNISGWDTSSLVLANSMFENASVFNQNLGSWDMTSVIGVDNMLSGSGMDWQNYDSTLNGWAAQSVQQNRTFTASGLEYCASAIQRDTLIDIAGWDISGDTQNSSLCSPTEIRFSTSDSSNLAIEENVPSGDVLGQFLVTDGDSDQDTYVFDFLCQLPMVDTQFFSVLGDSLVMESVLDFELPTDADEDNTYKLCVRVTDQTGNVFEQQMSIVVNDIEDEQEDEEEGQVLGAVDDNESSDGEQGQVLGESDGDVLAETGFSAVTIMIVGGIIVISVLAIGVLRNVTYSLVRN